MSRFVFLTLICAVGLALGLGLASANTAGTSASTPLQIEPWHDSETTERDEEVDLDEIRARTGLEIEPVSARPLDRKPGILHDPVAVNEADARRAGLTIGDSVRR